jgi:hypothetical protein
MDRRRLQRMNSFWIEMRTLQNTAELRHSRTRASSAARRIAVVLTLEKIQNLERRKCNQLRLA